MSSQKASFKPGPEKTTNIDNAKILQKYETVTFIYNNSYFKKH
jgi:hypothetical protein